MLWHVLCQGPESHASACGEYDGFQLGLPFRACLTSRSVSRIIRAAPARSFDSPVTRMTGSVPLSRTRTQLLSVLTRSPYLSLIDEPAPNFSEAIGQPLDLACP